MVVRWTCNQKIGGSNPVTVILRTSVPGIFSHFQVSRYLILWDVFSTFRDHSGMWVRAPSGYWIFFSLKQLKSAFR